jgi:hypothetical protein
MPLEKRAPTGGYRVHRRQKNGKLGDSKDRKSWIATAPFARIWPGLADNKTIGYCLMPVKGPTRATNAFAVRGVGAPLSYDADHC